MKETALQCEDEGILVFSSALVRPDSGAMDATSLVLQSELSRPGSAEFASASKALDTRSLGYRVPKRAFDRPRGATMLRLSLASARRLNSHTFAMPVFVWMHIASLVPLEQCLARTGAEGDHEPYVKRDYSHVEC